HGYAVSSLMDTGIGCQNSILRISSFKFQNTCLLPNLHKWVAEISGGFNLQFLCYIMERSSKVSWSSNLEGIKDIAFECLKLGLVITLDPILILHAAHYMCGEVRAGIQEETNVSELYVAGDI
ncbi:hypothetical protein Tco_0067566, partial [Tanacetum coccineum]